MADYQNPILIVDDDSLILETVTDVLRMEGFNTIGTTDSLSVPSILEANPVEIVVSDVNMPNMDGLQLLDEINKLEPKLGRHFLVIILTGTGNEWKALEAVKKGAFQYLSKPFNIDYFTNTVKRAILQLRLP
ncbi:MAG: response regulator [Candidatus Wallbacteria bacterium]|nr:response regulator [Candidatus Wallbacteria bacterium]MBI4869684.1 response regulator [Candidatus Wallbacteria bacterium]